MHLILTPTIVPRELLSYVKEDVDVTLNFVEEIYSNEEDCSLPLQMDGLKNIDNSWLEAGVEKLIPLINL